MTYALTWLENNIASVASLFVAVATYWVSWLTYKRDSGRIDFYVGMGGLHAGDSLEKLADIIQFQIVNSGRRPLMIRDMGGDIPRSRIKYLLSSLMPEAFKNRSFLLQTLISDAYMKKNGRSVTLGEGEDVSFHLPLPDHRDVLKAIADARTFYVFDTMGRKHRVKPAVLKKLRSDYLKYLEKTRPNPKS